ncbi:MAG: cardiolipin synthase [Oscillospiraceae bacterium]|nr:cardiolipin synthase [Oscillospiraceae bacterium]
MEQERRIVRLAKPVKKGLLRLIFSRVPVIALLLALQVLILLTVYSWLSRYLPHFAAGQAFFTAIMIVYLFNNRMDSSAKLTWMWIISLAPIPGTIFLLFTQRNWGHRKMRERVEQIITATKSELEQDKKVLSALEKDGSGTDDLARYLCRSGCFPIYDTTAVDYFPSGEEKFTAMLEELEKAEHFIYMEYFIIEEGEMWGEILDVLIRKAQAGVDVRVMYDGMCEIKQLPVNYRKLLTAKGIKSKAFAPIIPVVSSHYNYRDHRKILVIDGKVAFNGGVNLADEYINRVKRFGHWKDTAVRLRGPAVRSFTLMFLQMWNLDEESPDFSACHVPVKAEPACGYVIPYGDCPLDEDKVGETVYMDILNRATDYVHIMTPYLILDGEMETALKYAAQRGVDVKLILPGIPDKKAAYALAKTHYRALTDAGVKLYEYTPGFVHAKVFVSDDRKAVVGTINLDYRSLYHHFECATYLYQADCIPDTERDFQETLAKCRAITAESIQKEKLSYKLLGGIMKFVAPLM